MMPPKFLLPFLIWHLVSTVEPLDLLNISLEGQLTLDPRHTAAASTDFGGCTRSDPLAVLRPLSTNDVVAVVRAAYDSPTPFPVSARGHGHSVHGQAGATGGVVVEMSHHGITRAKATRRSPPVLSTERMGGYHVDVWGGELWIDVLRWTLQNGGLAPISWTDYLYLSVGGTLSNAGISGQAFRHGPQISNVLELDVVTGKGEALTCSKEQNQELFHAVLGGLGQFGIITRARIALEPAPKRTRWIRMLYSNFTAFAKDQEHLISLHGDAAAAASFDYVEGFVMVDEGLAGNWRSSFFSAGDNNNDNPMKTTGSVVSNGTLLYCLEVAKNYDDSTADSVDEEVEVLLQELDFIPGTVFTTDMAFMDFLDRVHAAEMKLRSMGLWEVPHPWLNLFVPGSKIAQFDQGVFKHFLRERSKSKPCGPILVYPMNKSKWDEKSSVVVPDEEVFYLVAFLRSAIDGAGDDEQTLDHLTEQNDRITRFCHEAGIGCKQYLPHHTGGEEWRQHFGEKWETFRRWKAEFDPRGILGTGQGIFRVIDSVPIRSS